MRPHKLTISGFLSYGGCETIDFDTLASAGGLFLIQGTTGAGKTSILDALAFALYGTLPGSRKAAARTYRSDFADRDTITYVELEVTLRGDRYIIKRIPAYDRPKKTGEGTTPQKAELKIKKMVNGDWQPFSSTTQEGGEALTDLIGLDSSQFFKLILLPQGDFAKFLQSSGKERQEILEKLFSDEVEKFIALTDHFWDEYNKATKSDAESAVNVQGEIQRITQAFEIVYSGAERDLTLADPNSADLTKAYVAALSEVKEKAEKAVSAAEEAKSVALEREKEATTLFENSDRVRKAKEQLTTAQAALAQWRELNKDDVALKIKDEKVIAELNSLIESVNSEITSIANSNEKITGLLAQRADLISAEGELIRAKEELKNFEDVFKADDEEIKALEDVVNGDANPEAERAKNELEIKNLDDQISLVEKWNKSVEAIKKIEENLEELIAISDKKLVEYKKLEHEFDSAQASVLAEKLEKGAPCPVCGSTDHPAPAKKSGSATKSDVSKALKASQDAAQSVAGKESELKGAREKSEELVAGKDGDLDALKSQVAALREKDNQFAAAITALGKSRSRLKELKASHEKSAEIRETLTSAVTSAKTSVTTLKSAVTKMEKELKIEAGSEIALNETKPLTDKVSRLRGLIEKFEPVLTAFNSADAAVKALSTSGAEEAPDLAAAVAAREAAETELNLSSLKFNRLKTLESELMKIEKTLRTAEADQKKAKVDVEKYERLAKFFMGKTGEKITLVSYFLGQRLHQILERANERLQTMTRGQFSLQPNHEKKGAGQNYLSISVFDSWNQGLRDANSLSGGETFTTSLALAFGLADVVTSEAGGQSLDSLFIDEGFGSLDPEYLQAVMQSLEELRESGRVVGLISHVEEMKQRISMQLLVSKDGTIGTQVKVIENIGG